MKKISPFVFSAALLMGGIAAPSFAVNTTVEVEVATTSVVGSVAMPERVPVGINVEGITLTDSVVLLEGEFTPPRMPYPDNWSEITPTERRAWRTAFMKTEAYEDFSEKLEAARAKRDVYKTTLGEDGSFGFEGVKPGWYQLSVMNRSKGAEGKATFSTSRAYAMKQFVIKDVSDDYKVGQLTFKVQNVLLPGNPAPAWEGVKYDGSEVKLSDYRGKYVLLDYWATWCGPCIGELPNLKSVYEEFGGDRFEIVGLSIDKSIDLPIAFEKKKPSAHQHVFLGAGAEAQAIKRAYGISAIPSIWLIDPEGNIVARDLRGEGLKEAVRKALTGE